jgi:hypothetical protein
LIDPNLFADAKALDRTQHRGLRVDFEAVRHERTAGMNSMFVAAVEFGDVCREYPIVFIDAGKNESGLNEAAPVAVFGLGAGENLMLGADGRWDARYVPALLRGYPFGIARADATNYVVVIDAAHAAAPSGQGERVFDDAGAPTPALEGRRKFIEAFEQEAQRTRVACHRLLELDLLRPMRFDATLPDGSTVGVDGFQTVNEERLAALTDAQVVEMHKSGLLGLIHAHQISLPLMRRRVERRLDRAASAKA